MVEGSWWNAAVGVGLGLLGIGGSAALLRRKKGGPQQQEELVERWRRRRRAEAEAEAADEGGDEEGFVCKRVCASERMLKRVGGFAKEATPGSCVTVCGVSALDACAEACARAVCANPHHVPNWNQLCMRRCQNECLRSS